MFTKIARNEDEALRIAEVQYERCNYTVSVLYQDSDQHWFHLYGKYWKTELKDVTNDIRFIGNDVYIGGTKEFNYGDSYHVDDIVRFCCSISVR